MWGDPGVGVCAVGPFSFFTPTVSVLVLMGFGPLWYLRVKFGACTPPGVFIGDGMQ